MSLFFTYIKVSSEELNTVIVIFTSLCSMLTSLLVSPRRIIITDDISFHLTIYDSLNLYIWQSSIFITKITKCSLGG